MKLEELYTSGEYLEKWPAWHVEESPWRAEKILRMMERNHLTPKTICEVGMRSRRDTQTIASTFA